MIKADRVELLSPAGNMDCLVAAVKAGADAVYLAGKRFGARASADNFDDNELISALDFAHTYEKKIYLTLNTLIKEREWSDIYGFLKPLYEAGLDGIIIQDLGLIGYLKEQFPLLPLHASTQMTITDVGSVNILKDMGVCRVVTARELSLDEIERIKQETGTEVEVFIHGAMCYSYSGACLFSSYLGGRSGNRGRCAGPCRLPYNGGDYPLSMRDLCLIDNIGELIRAGVDSFKIEGRLKSPEYVTGVTRVYRECIDRYYESGISKITNEDKDRLDSLYIRGGYSTGYLHSHNSADMISIKDPSYKGPSDDRVNELTQWVRKKDARLQISAVASFHVKQPMRLKLTYDNDVIVETVGAEVEKASNKAALWNEVADRLRKTGNTPYVINDLDIDMDEDCFISVKALNELRREAIDKLTSVRLGALRRGALSKKDDADNVTVRHAMSDKSYAVMRTEVHSFTDVSVTLPSQLDAVSGHEVDRVYVPYDLIYTEKISTETLINFSIKNPGTDIFISLPRIERHRSKRYMDDLTAFVNETEFCKGLLVKNLEELDILRNGLNEDVLKSLTLTADNSLYAWNARSLKTVLGLFDEMTLPYELNIHELEDMLTMDCPADRISIAVYGRAPLMISAGCVKNTYGKCGEKKDAFSLITDRQGMKEPVYNNCVHCYNVIYNAKPTSYHKYADRLSALGIGRFKIELTDEDSATAAEIIDYYIDQKRGKDTAFPVADYTAGHIAKGAI